jgi:hypothetical protein
VSVYSYSVIIGLIERIVVEVFCFTGEGEYISDLVQLERERGFDYQIIRPN